MREGRFSGGRSTSAAVTTFFRVPAEVREALADELRQLSPNLPRALAEISLPAYVLDRQGTLVWQNAASLELFGDRRGEHYTAVVAPEARQIAKEQFTRKMVGATRTTSYDSVLIAGNGRRFEAEVETVRLEEHTDVVGVFGIVEVRQFTDSGTAAQIHLTPRQLQVLKLLASGCSTNAIASELHLSRETVRNYVRSVLRALQVHSRLQAVVRARELGIV